MTASATKFRQVFDVGKDIINWYPGHMRHSFTHMEAKMRQVDCVIEVHDSRVPFSGRNPMFLKKLLGTKPHILVLNKIDLSDVSLRKRIDLKYSEIQNNIVFVNCLKNNCEGLKKILPLALNLVQEHCIVPKSGDERYRLMVVGIPNVGKSTLINALRNMVLKTPGRATAVGSVAGVTRKVQNEIKVSSNPPLYLIDTPGILCPQILDAESGMKLALCGCLKDENIGIPLIADFLLYWMNKTQNFEYVHKLNLKEPVDKVFPILVKIAHEFNKIKKIKDISSNKILEVPNTYFAAQHLIKLYRKGIFGDINLDGAFLK